MEQNHQDKPITVGPRYTLLGGVPWDIKTIGDSIDRMSAAYTHYLNRATRLEGVQAIKDFQLAGNECLNKIPAVYEWAYSTMNLPAPPINRKVRNAVQQSLVTFEPFSGRWLTFLQFCQHLSVRIDVSKPETKVRTCELFYEMYHWLQELLELSEKLNPDPDKSLLEGIN